VVSVSAYGLPPGFSDVQSLAATGHGEVFRACVAAASAPSAPPEQIAVVLADSPITAKGARRLMRGDCLAAAVLNGTPGILPVRDLAFTDEQRPFLVTDPVLGTLQQRIADRGPLPVAEAVALGLTLARALAAAHAAGVLHLGVGTDSVFILPGAAGPGAALGHFGFAWAVRRPSRPEAPAAALVHAPRELFGWEEPGASSDVYGLGSVLRTALTGRPAFEDEARAGRAALYHRLLQGPAPALAGTHRQPEELARLLDHMMEPEASQRPAIEHVIAVLEALAAGVPATLGVSPSQSVPLVVSQSSEPPVTYAATATVPPPATWPPTIVTTPNTESATAVALPQTARRRHTPLVLLATAAAAALAAGVVWGIVTAPGHHAANQTSSDSRQAKPLTVAEQAPYLAAGVTAKPDGPNQITVTWRTPSSMAGVSAFLIRASLYGHWDVEQTADPTATSRAFTGLTPGKYYCFAVYTIVERPGAQPRFALTTVDDKACAFPGK
jgi:serine/threonine protein kinase